MMTRKFSIMSVMGIAGGFCQKIASHDRSAPTVELKRVQRLRAAVRMDLRADSSWKSSHRGRICGMMMKPKSCVLVNVASPWIGLDQIRPRLLSLSLKIEMEDGSA